MDTASVLGWVATVMFTVCYVPQIIKTYRSETIEGLSFLLLFISFIANIVALAYATMIAQPPLQVKYFLAITLLAATLVLYVKTWYSQKARDRLDPQPIISLKP
jgi:uncharacterized protein with PQ loop repeat